MSGKCSFYLRRKLYVVFVCADTMMTYKSLNRANNINLHVESGFVNLPGPNYMGFHKAALRRLSCFSNAFPRNVVATNKEIAGSGQ